MTILAILGIITGETLIIFFFFKILNSTSPDREFKGDS